MAALMTSYDVTRRHDPQKLSHLLEQANGFLLNVNLFRCALIQRAGMNCRRLIIYLIY